jgi:hypothetical protein
MYLLGWLLLLDLSDLVEDAIIQVPLLLQSLRGPRSRRSLFWRFLCCHVEILVVISGCNSFVNSVTSFEMGNGNWVSDKAGGARTLILLVDLRIYVCGRACDKTCSSPVFGRKA